MTPASVSTSFLRRTLSQRYRYVKSQIGFAIETASIMKLPSVSNFQNHVDTLDAKYFRNGNRHFHGSCIQEKSSDEIHVTIENTNSTKNKIDDSKSKSTCSQGIPLDNEEDEEEDQEEMFVVADPVLGHGTIQEWGGPRRGGTLAEPTRYGDWERKGRCTDF
mmetsp:Transcript_17550/g.34098  ORF Transcript_17550/g.34098 Transcript_17550/m.34098 type:complete len:162 (+) Transcript_17550:141-626(+)